MIGLLVLASFGIAILSVAGGVALSRRVGWPLFVPGLLSLLVSMVAGCSVAVIAPLYFSRSRPNGTSPDAIPWIERLGIGLIVATVAFFVASLCLLFAACIPPIRRALPGHASRR